MKKNVIKSAVAVALAVGIVAGNGVGALADSTYVVQKNDNLWNIAKAKLGSGTRYKEIFEANRDKIQDPSKIQVGQELRIPDVTSSATEWNPTQAHAPAAAAPAETATQAPAVSDEFKAYIGTYTGVALYMDGEPISISMLTDGMENVESKSLLFEKPDKITIKEDKTFELTNEFNTVTSTVDVKDGVLTSTDDKNITAGLSSSNSMLTTEMKTDYGTINGIYVRDTSLVDPTGKLNGSWTTMVVLDDPDSLSVEVPDAMLAGATITFDEAAKTFSLGEDKATSLPYTVENGFVTLKISDEINMPFFAVANAKSEVIALKSMPLLDTDGSYYSCVLEPVAKTSVPFSKEMVPGTYKDVLAFDGYSAFATKVIDNFQMKYLGTDPADYYDTTILRTDGTGSYIYNGTTKSDFFYTVDEENGIIYFSVEKDGEPTSAFIYSEDTGNYYSYGTYPYDIIYVTAKEQ